MSAKMTPGPWATNTAIHPDDQVFAGGAIIADCKWTNHVPLVREANARAIAAVPDLIAALLYMNHMGGDERGGYCICPLNNGSKPDEKHASVCADARKALRKAGAL